MFRIYSPELLEDCFATIDCMSQYSNTLGLVVANGALSTIYSTAAAPMIKTVIRDVKRYMATAYESVGQRRLPLGYSASNSRLILKSTFNYFSSGNEEEAVDFFCVSKVPQRNPLHSSMASVLMVCWNISTPTSTGVANLPCISQAMMLRYVAFQ